MDGTVLVADDDKTIRTVLTQALTRAGCKVHATSSLTTLLRWVGEGLGDLVVTDVVMPDGNGIEMLPKIAADRPDLPVIVISAQNTIMTAVQASNADAYDYLPKPFDLPDLMKKVGRGLEERRRAPVASDMEPQGESELPLVGRSARMQTVYRNVARVLHTELPLLITGESGTGKSLIAKSVHALSNRPAGAFEVLDSMKFTESYDAGEMLSRIRGGSLVLDGLTEFTDAQQARLVRVCDSAEQNSIRLMATLQQGSNAALESGTLRDDLYYRLSGATIGLPPLRERVEDVSLLAEHFVAQYADQGPAQRVFTEEALDVARAYPWPGNVRQLELVVRRLGLAAGGREITKAELEADLGPINRAVSSGSIAVDEKLSDSIRRHLQRYFDLHQNDLPPPGVYQRVLRELELPLIEVALDATGGNQARCAELLGINRNTLRKKMTDLDIHVTRRRQLM